MARDDLKSKQKVGFWFYLILFLIGRTIIATFLEVQWVGATGISSCPYPFYAEDIRGEVGVINSKAALCGQDGENEEGVATIGKVSGSFLVLDMGDYPIIDSEGVDFYYFERPEVPGIRMDFVEVSIAPEINDGKPGTFTPVFIWGDNDPTNNGTIPENIPEFPNHPIPEVFLDYGWAIGIDIKDKIDPEIGSSFRFVRIRTWPPEAVPEEEDLAEVDAFLAQNSHTPTPSPLPSLTSAPGPRLTNTPIPFPTDTYTPTPTETPLPTATFTSTPSNTVSPTFTNTSSPTITETPSPTETFTSTPTSTVPPTVSGTSTPTPSATYTPAETFTPTSTPSNTPAQAPTKGTISPQPTNTFTPEPTNTLKATNPVPSPITNTASPLPSLTPSPTQTETLIVTSSPNITNTQTITPTFTQTTTEEPTLAPTSTQTTLPTPTDTTGLTVTHTPTIPIETPTSPWWITPLSWFIAFLSSMRNPGLWAEIFVVWVLAFIGSIIRIRVPNFVKNIYDAFRRLFLPRPIININTASLEVLISELGLRPDIARKVDDYRNEMRAHGVEKPFEKIEDIMKKVNGLGEKTYSKIKDYIKVD